MSPHSKILTATVIVAVLTGASCGREPDRATVDADVAVGVSEPTLAAPAPTDHPGPHQPTGKTAVDDHEVEDDGRHHRLTEDEIPADALQPSQHGTRGARSFAGFLAAVRSEREGFPAPRPETMSELTDRVEVVARGTITKAELVPVTFSDDIGPIGRIDLRLTLDPEEVRKTAAGIGKSPQTWSIEVFYGDPVLLRRTLEMRTAELGEGPVGSRALLYGNPWVPKFEGEPAPSQLGIFDGVIEDDTGAARLATDPGSTPKELHRIATALAAAPPP